HEHEDLNKWGINFMTIDRQKSCTSIGATRRNFIPRLPKKIVTFISTSSAMASKNQSLNQRTTKVGLGEILHTAIVKQRP
ncbi:hypothetical protein DKX15_20975, partial [Enterococcus faecium]